MAVIPVEEIAKIIHAGVNRNMSSYRIAEIVIKYIQETAVKQKVTGDTGHPNIFIIEEE